jgi:hypothetical protein
VFNLPGDELHIALFAIENGLLDCSNVMVHTEALMMQDFL